jgi:protein-S-isoprenylcysteine O-methyltransferase Ste14
VPALLLYYSGEKAKAWTHGAVEAILKSAAACDPRETTDCPRYLAGTLNIPGANALMNKGGKKTMSHSDMTIVTPQTAEPGTVLAETSAVAASEAGVVAADVEPSGGSLPADPTARMAGTPNSNMTLNAKVIVGRIIQFLLIALILFLSAGTVAWIAGWIFLILFYSFSIPLDRMLLKHDPGLMEERVTMFKPNQKGWDKVFVTLFYVIFIAWLALMPLDAVRFHWSQVPVWLQVVGALALSCSFFLMYLTFRENPYLSSMVRMQEERGQTVVSTGPYRYVRHPLYASSLLFIPGIALLLGSSYGLLLSVVFMGMFAVRAVLEERVLREELQGYDAYMAQVKYRLIPHVW